MAIGDNERGDLFELYVDDALMGMAQLTWSGPVSAEPVYQASRGRTPVAMLVNAVGGELRISAKDLTDAQYARLLNIAGNGTVPAVGSLLATTEVALHDPNDADRSKDLCFRRVAWTASRTVDGQGERVLDIVGMVLHDAAGTVQRGSPVTILGWAE